MQDKYIYQENTIEFVKVAAQVCLLLEHISETDRDTFVEQSLRLLPVLYLRARMLSRDEVIFDGEPQRFVSEWDYQIVSEGVKTMFGSDDGFLDVFIDDFRYSSEPVMCSLSENIADIYQEIKDMAAAFSTGDEEVMHDAVVVCEESFREHWGQKLLNTMRALHNLSLDDVQKE